MILSNNDRQKFIEWLTQECESEKIILEQMSKMSMCEPLVAVRKRELAAQLIVLNKLKNISTETIG